MEDLRNLMSKQTMQDIIPPEKRSIRRVPLGNSARPLQPKGGPSESTAPMPSPVPKSSMVPPLLPPQRERLGSRRWPRYVAIAVGILILAFVLLSFTAGVTVTLTPRQEQVTVSGAFTAGPVKDLDVIPYKFFSLTREAGKRVAALGEKYVEAKASGGITVFNDFDAAPQLLIANTRFETPSGLVYRIQEPVTVPGQTADGSGGTVPGSIDVRVVADEPGEQYNVGLTDFTLPGLKESGDTERYEAFFARSKTTMVGGFAGAQKTIDTTLAEETRNELDRELENDLYEAVQAELPEGLVTYPEAFSVSFADLPQESTDKEGEVVLRRSGTLQAVVFDGGELTSFIAENTIAVYDGSPVSLANPGALTFSFVEGRVFDPALSEEFEFTLSGQAEIVWVVDTERLREDLAGKHKRDTEMILSAYPSVAEADISIRPFWKKTFPETVEDIRIEYTLAGGD